MIDSDGKGTISNPMGKCDSRGQITIKVPKHYLKAGDEFTLGRILQIELRDEKGNFVTFKFPAKLQSDTINLGHITLKN